MSLVYRSEPSGGGGKRNNIYLGGKLDAKDLSSIRAKGITHILNVTPPKEAGVKAGVPNYFESSNILVYKRINVYDAPTSDLLFHADEAVKFIASGLCHGSVLVHCHHGVSRSTTCVAFYLMRKAGMTLEDALTNIREMRPEAQPIPEFMEQLRKYEAKCRSLGVIKMQPAKKRPIGPTWPSQGLPETITQFSESKKLKMIGPSMEPTISIGDTPLQSTGSDETVVQSKDTQSPTLIGPSLPTIRDSCSVDSNEMEHIAIANLSRPPDVDSNSKTS